MCSAVLVLHQPVAKALQQVSIRSWFGLLPRVLRSERTAWNPLRVLRSGHRCFAPEPLQ